MSKGKILIVEDEGITALYLKNALEGLGYDVAGVSSYGDDAINKAADLRPDLVLMDIVLKGAVDGIDAAEKIHAILNIPVIYLTAHVDEATLKRAKPTEPFGYIVKPYKERDLQITIEFALYKATMERERNLLVHRLQDALEHVRTLRGMLPICSYCKKIRDDEGYWKQLEAYLRDHSEAEFTHSICPDCAVKVKEDLDRELDKEY